MDIKQLARKPKLVEVVIDDENIVETYGDKITFYMMDFVDINTYFDFFRSQSEKNNGELNAMLQSIILNSEGKPALEEGDSLPIDIAVATLTRINETLGKSNPKPLTSNPGNQEKWSP